MKFGNTRHVTVTPVISATPDYTAGDAVGGVQTVGPLGSHNGSGILKTVAITDAANQKPVLTLLLFKALPTGTYTDNGAAAPSAGDRLVFLGKINIAATDWETINSVGYATVDVAHVIKGDVDRKLYVVAVVTAGGLNFGAADDLNFQYGFLLD